MGRDKSLARAPRQQIISLCRAVIAKNDISDQLLRNTESSYDIHKLFNAAL